MKQANHVFEKVTKYAIRKLSVGVGPVAIGTFLLAGGLFVSKPVSADRLLRMHRYTWPMSQKMN